MFGRALADEIGVRDAGNTGFVSIIKRQALSSWQQSLLNMLRGQSASNVMHLVSSVSEILRAFGALGQNVVMVASKLKKVISDHKELSPQDLMDLPHLIENPVFMIRQDDDKQTGNLMLVTDRTASKG